MATSNGQQVHFVSARKGVKNGNPWGFVALVVVEGNQGNVVESFASHDVIDRCQGIGALELVHPVYEQRLTSKGPRMDLVDVKTG